MIAADEREDEDVVTMHRGRVLAWAAAAAVGVLVSTATPASAAVAAFGPTKLVGASCQSVYSATASDGTTRGAMACDAKTAGTEIVFFRGNGTTWTRVRSGVKGSVFAFADDGTSYFAVYQPLGISKGAVYLLKRNHATGAQTRITLRAPSASTPDDYLAYAALIASGGRYWAAYTINNGALLFGKTLTRQTLVPSLPRTFPAVEGWEPALARRGTGGVSMVVSQPPPMEAGIIVRYASRADGTWSRSVLRSAAGGRSPQILWSNGVTRVCWLEATPQGDYKVVYQDDASGSWKRLTVPGLRGNGFPYVRMFNTGGKLSFVWTGYRAGDSTKSGRIAIAQRVSGVWQTASITDGTADNLLLEAGSWKGRLIVIMTSRSKPTRPIESRRQA